MSYVPEPEDAALLNSAIRIFLKFNRYPDAVMLAVRLNDMEKVKKLFMSCSGRFEKYLLFSIRFSQILCGLEGVTNNCLP